MWPIAPGASNADAPKPLRPRPRVAHRRPGHTDGVNDTQVIDVTDESFERDVVDRSRTQPVVVDFWAAWCGPCRALGPTIEDVVRKTPGVTLAKLDVDANQGTAARFGIRSIPAVKAFRDGRVVDEFLGLQPRQNVERFIARLAPVVEEALPHDEAGLLSVLESSPGNLAARRALGRLLLGAGRFDDAEQLLAVEPLDQVGDGLRARIELLRGGDGSLPASINRRIAAEEINGMPDLIAAIRTADGETKSRLRRVALGVLAAQGDDDPAVETLRGQLASALF